MLLIKCPTQKDYLRAVDDPMWQATAKIEDFLCVKNNTNAEFNISGYCRPCQRAVDFLVDRRWGGELVRGVWRPNWRERLSCPHCQLNNRQRVIAALIADFMKSWKGAKPPRIYLMERFTPIYEWIKKNYPKAALIASEYFGADKKSGEVISGAEHQNFENLSFDDESFDLVVSNDVFERLADPEQGIRETARVLAHSGQLLFTVPFNPNGERNEVRAKVVDGNIIYVMPPEYYGTPVSDKGSLVFTTFGWEMLSSFRSNGFSQVDFNLFWSYEYGHLGRNLAYFHGRK